MSQYQDDLNRENREQWLACGFTGEPEKDEYGWIYTVLKKFWETTTIEVFGKNCCWASVEYAQLPNGKWVAASDANFATHGYGSAASTYDKQYETKEEAITVELDRIENSMEEKDRQPFVLKALEACRKKYKKLEANTTATVFDIDPEFYYGKNFQQTSLFYEEPTLF